METVEERVARLERENAELKAENERLRRRVEELMRALEEAQRAGKRQAAPFSRRAPKAHPAKPGRKAGAKYGRRCPRPIPGIIDQTVEAELAASCPHCGEQLMETGIENQYQTEIPKPRVERIELHIHVGRWKRCGQRVQGRHPRQTSDAVGGAASQLGARAVGLATELNKGLGLSYGKTAAVLENAFGLRVSRGGLAQAFERVAKKAEPTYEKLVERIRGSPSVTPDETGWKVGGQLWWMWAFSSAAVTVYSIQPGRGFKQAAVVLGTEYDGFLVRDGWREGWMDRLPGLFPGHSPNLLGTPAAALPGNDGGGPAGSGAVSSDCKRHSASCLTTAGSAGSRRDRCAGIGGCLRTVGSAHGSGLATTLSHTPQSASGQPSHPGAGRDVHLLILSRIGGDQLPCRTSHSSDGGHAEGVGRKSHTAGSTHAKRFG